MKVVVGSNVAGKTVAGACAAAAVLAGGFGAAPTANATCASLFGIGNSSECSSTPLSIAIAIGTGATAKAEGLFGSAFAFGANAEASTSNAFTFASAIGDDSTAGSGGIFGVAAAWGPKSIAQTGGDPSLGGLGFNIAVNVSPVNQAFQAVAAGGVGNLAVNLFGYSTGPTPTVTAYGFANSASNIGGENSFAQTAGSFSSAFNVLGSGNFVVAGTGPFAVAGSVLQTSSTVTKFEPGFNINGFRVPSSAAADGPAVPAPAASTSRTGVRPAGAVGAEAGPDSGPSKRASKGAERSGAGGGQR